MKRRAGPALVALLLAVSCASPPTPTVEIVRSPPPAPNRDPQRPPESGPRGETAALRSGGVVITRPFAAAQTLPAEELHAPPGDRSLHGVWPRALLFLDDGTLLVGAEDGTVTAIDGAGHRRWALGLHGAIRGLIRAGDDLAAVTTDRGVLALVTGAGRARWERQVTAERLGAPLVVRGPGGVVRAILAASHRGVFAFSPEGQPLFTHAAPFVHQGCPQAASGNWAPLASASTCVESPGEPPPLEISGDEVQAGPALRFRLDGPHPPVPSLVPTFPLGFARILLGDVAALLPDGPDAVLALVCHAGRDYGYYDPRLVAQLRHGCKIVLVAATATELASVPEQAVRRAFVVQGKKVPAQSVDLVVDAMIRGPEGRPWILARRIPPESFGCEDASCGPPAGEALILELRGAKLVERKEPIEPFSGAVTGYPLVGASDGARALLCAADGCAARGGASDQPLDWPGAVLVQSAAFLAGRTWLIGGGGAHRGKGARFEPVAAPDHAYLTAVAGVSESDVWADAVQRYGLLHFDGARWTEVPTPPALGGLAARASDDVWSGRMRWDGKRWALVDGAPDATVVLARGRDDVWMGTPGGLWHGTAPGPRPVDLAPPPPDDGSPPPAPLARGAPESRYTVELRTPAAAKAAPPTLPEASAPPERAWALTGARSADTRDAEAMEARTKGLLLWEEVAPHARVRDGQAWRPVLGLPSATWVDIAEAADGGAWFAGGLGPGPSGEGILFHAGGRLGAERSLRVRAPASLLAVAAKGASEAWAVGAAGILVHVRDGDVTRSTLTPGEWLRAVLVAEDGVWIGGDGGTLLHGDGEGAGWRSVVHPLGGNASFTRITAAGGAVWAAGPSGVVRIAKRP